MDKFVYNVTYGKLVQSMHSLKGERTEIPEKGEKVHSFMFKKVLLESADLIITKAFLFPLYVV